MLLTIESYTLYRLCVIVVMVSQVSVLILLIITNSLLLHYVLFSALPSADRNHNNYVKLTRTILIVNFVLIFSWLPNAVVTGYIFLVFYSNFAIASYESFELSWIWICICVWTYTSTVLWMRLFTWFVCHVFEHSSGNVFIL